MERAIEVPAGSAPCDAPFAGDISKITNLSDEPKSRPAMPAFESHIQAIPLDLQLCGGWCENAIPNATS